MFANSQITRPAGAAIQMALPKTNNVLSKIERIIIFPNWGFLYGGSSSMKDDGRPFNIVFESILETMKVRHIPKIITKTTAKVETIEAVMPLKAPAMKIVATEIRKGNLPVTWHKIVSKNSN